VTYPIPVADYDPGDQALTIVCERCDSEAVISADDLRTEGLYRCPGGCPGSAVHKYELADECPNCKALGWFDRMPFDGACSRRCMFQFEYALELAARKASA
jgi:hypothetical protein